MKFFKNPKFQINPWILLTTLSYCDFPVFFTLTLVVPLNLQNQFCFAPFSHLSLATSSISPTLVVWWKLLLLHNTHELNPAYLCSLKPLPLLLHTWMYNNNITKFNFGIANLSWSHLIWHTQPKNHPHKPKRLLLPKDHKERFQGVNVRIRISRTQSQVFRAYVGSTAMRCHCPVYIYERERNGDPQ